ncbi:MAG: hypothetical protein ACKO8G_05200 [Actinomycetota bacterium]
MAPRGNAVRRASATLCAAAIVALAACGGGGRELVEYHDPGGRFVASLPASAQFTAAEPTADTSSGPGLLAGVLASPRQASGGTGVGIDLAQASGDQTSFQVLLLRSEGFESLDDMALFFLPSRDGFDIREQRDLDIEGDPGQLVVADVLRDGTAAASVAVVFSLGHAGVGSVIAAVFPTGTWASERDDFLAIVRSFRTDVSPAEAALPVGVPTAA